MESSEILSRLNKVRNTGAGTWVACCPAHQDKSPSLAIREMEDGRILLHCFAGCSAVDVVSAMGFELSDLFPDSERSSRVRNPFPLRDVLSLLYRESLIVMLAAKNVAKKLPLHDHDYERVKLAYQRINEALEVTQ